VGSIGRDTINEPPRPPRLGREIRHE
jgi:hypothetical protein